MKAFLQGLYLDTHCVSIAPVQKMSARRAREYIQQTTGLTPEQSAAILVRAFDMPVSPVLPAIKRVLARVALAPQKASETRFHDAFQAVAAKGKASTAHRVLQMLAKDFCLKESPLCARCPIKKHCPTGQDIEATKKAAKKKAAKKKAAKKKAAKKKAAKKRAVSKRRKPKAKKKKKVTRKKAKSPKRRTRKPKSLRRKKK
jgi:adenine-specific DNA glycosylase